MKVSGGKKLTLISRIVRLANVSSHDKLVLFILAEQSDADGKSFMAQQTISERTKLSRRRVWQSLVDLAERGYIAKTHRPIQKGRKSDVVRLLICEPDFTEPELPQLAPDATGATRTTSDPQLARGAQESGLSLRSSKIPGQEGKFLKVVGGTEA